MPNSSSQYLEAIYICVCVYIYIFFKEKTKIKGYKNHIISMNAETMFFVSYDFVLNT